MMNESSNLFYAVHGDRAKPALVLLHGFMGNSDDWADIVPLLSDRWRCITIDLPGHGKTKTEGAESFRMEACAESITSLLDELDISRSSLMGYSMGGRLAMYLAVNYSNRFDSVIIESASPGLETTQEREMRIEHDHALAELLMTMPLNQFVEQWYWQALFATIDRDSAKFADMVQRRLQGDPKGLSMSLRFMGTGSQPSLWRELGRIVSPLLLIVGRHDAKFRQIAEDICDRCIAARAVIIDNAGHNVHFENPEEYVKQVSLFLDNTRKE